MAEPEPVITDMLRANRADRGRDPALVAVFSYRVRWLLLRGVRLRWTEAEELTLSSPVMSRGRGEAARGAVIEDGELRAAIVSAAVRALPPLAEADRPAPHRHRGPPRP